jgi:hypothetical protein
LDVPEDIKALPDIVGSGVLYSLHQAMTRDSSGKIRAALEAYLAAEHGAGRNALFHELLYTWAGVEELNPNSRGGNMDARQLEFLEKVMGEGFIGYATGHSGQRSPNPNPNAATILKDLYNTIANEAESALLLQTVLVPFFKESSFEYDENQDALTITLDPSFAYLNDLFKTNRYEAFIQIDALRKVFKSIGILNGGESETQFREALSGEYPDLSIFFNSTHELIFAFADGENGMLTATSKNEIILAGDGNDTIYGGLGHDIINGGKGNDYLRGDDGNDVYVWNIGDGNDTINDYRYHKADWYGETGVLKIGEGVDPSKIELTRSDNNLILIIAETGERLTVENWYCGADYQITRVEFANGTIWTDAYLNSQSPVLRGTDGNDSMNGFNGQNNILIGGKGNDVITGKDGNDIYVWNLGDGNDVIDDYSYNKRYHGDTGILNIGAEVDPTLIALSRSSNDLVCEFTQTNESVTIQNWYSADYCQLTSMNFANGTTWTRANINAIASGTLSPFSTGS